MNKNPSDGLLTFCFDRCFFVCNGESVHLKIRPIIYFITKENQERKKTYFSRYVILFVVVFLTEPKEKKKPNDVTIFSRCMLRIDNDEYDVVFTSQ
jgi:hypothetical protein